MKQRKRDRIRDSVGHAVATLGQGMRFLMDPGPVEVDRTPRSVVFEKGKIRLVRFENHHDARPASPRQMTPVLLVPPLMVKPYIFDLRPGHSLAAFLMERGFDVFLVDFGVPDKGDEELNIHDYALRFLGEAVEQMQGLTGQTQVTLCGYCMGGLFALLYTAAATGRSVRNVVAMACPVDFGKMGLLHVVAEKANRQLYAMIDRIGNIPGLLPGIAMRFTNPLKSFVRYADLFHNIWNEEYLKGYQSLNLWLSDFIPGPRDTFKEYLQKFLVGNALMDGRVRLGESDVDVRNIRCSVLAIAGKTDRIATVESTREIVNVVGSTDKAFEVVSGGHVGIVAGARAPQTTWRLVADWLVPRSSAEVSQSGEAAGMDERRCVDTPLRGKTE